MHIKQGLVPTVIGTAVDKKKIIVVLIGKGYR